MKGQQYGRPFADTARTIAARMVQNLLAEQLVCGQGDAMHAAPNNEIEAGAVPKSAQKHGQNEVDILPQLAFPVATERDIDVIAYPSGQRDVPASPEIGDACGAIRRIEVEREAEPQQQCDANSHVAVATEVTIDLQCIAIDAEKVLHAAVKRGVIEDAVYEVEADIIADDRLFE